ncbi:eCIS core domain-containing protein [Undibacterium sp. Ji50W]|uniref:eCIS core domain-containing protein n=1 Tax=Undibacterium sp. Ji50W TaxID=3413041 RepID=UPI003BF28CA6
MSEHIHQTRNNSDSAVGNTLNKGAANRQQEDTAQLSQEVPARISSGFVDRRPQMLAQRQLQERGNNSPQARQLQAYSHMMQNSPRAMQLKALQAMMHKPLVQRADDEALQTKSASQGTAQLAVQANPRPNNTGLPNQLKAGIESLSGMSMDHVRVNYNSGKPAQLNAHAYAQGSEIHVAPGQEQHVPHEAWHVVQQAQGRVRPTMQMKQGVLVNDDAGLEAEADVMGAKALGAGASLSAGQLEPGGQHSDQGGDTIGSISPTGASRQLVTVYPAQGSSAPVQMLDVVGENHDESNSQRTAEEEYTKRIRGKDAGYWQEHEFALGVDEKWGDDKYLRMADIVYRLKEYYVEQSTSAWNFFREFDRSDKRKNAVIDILRKVMQVGKTRFIMGVSKEISSVLALNKKDKFPYVGKLSSSKFLEWGNEFVSVKKLHAATLLALEANDAVSNYDDVVLEVAVQMGAIADFGKQSVANYFVDKKNITQQRSEHMHNAANAAADKVGVWKVGETHVDDMEKIEQDKKYLLVHRGSFITALK